ncbi:MAG: hypothetical protein ACLGHN_06170 [Bacteriovoracia bacterium]
MNEKKEKRILEEQMDEAPVEKPMLHEGHKLKTRRDFLAQGFLGMTAFALAPSALTLLSRSAMAQTTGCSAPQMSGMTPVIIIDLAGGGNIAGSNVMVGGAGGQMDFLSDYASLGLPPDFHPSRSGRTNNEMGLVFHSDSGMLRGIQSIASNTTRSNMDGAVFCTTSDDDTGNNQSNPMYWLAKAGATGELRPLAGTSQSESGGNSKAPAESLNPTVAPVKISSDGDAVNLVSLGNRFTTNLIGRSDMVIDTAARLSNKKLEMIGRRSLPDKIRELIACSFNQTNDQISKFNENSISSASDAIITANFNMITNQNVRNRSRSIVKLVLDGYIGAGTIVLGGYDYHNGTRATGDTKDFELGQLIGAIMQSAAQKGKDVMVYVLTDGGVAARPTVDNTQGGGGKFIWTGDSGQRSATFMMVYKRDGKPGLRSANRQIGYFKANGAVEGSAVLTSNSVVTTSKAMVANYLALHGMEGRLEEIIGVDPFRTALDRYLVFDKLR